ALELLFESAFALLPEPFRLRMRVGLRRQRAQPVQLVEGDDRANDRAAPGNQDATPLVRRRVQHASELHPRFRDVDLVLFHRPAPLPALPAILLPRPAANARRTAGATPPCADLSELHRPARPASATRRVPARGRAPRTGS